MIRLRAWGFLLIGAFLLGFASTSFCADIWCNPLNQGFEDGRRRETGFRTLHNAISKMASGDKIIVANGDWRNNQGMFIAEPYIPPNGTIGNYSKIYAETEWEVKLPYIHIETSRQHGFLEFRGIVFDNRYIGKGIFHYAYNSHHTKFIQCGFLAHGLKGNMHASGFGNPDRSDRSKNQYNLMEDCVVWGSGRYMIISWNGQKNIFRRCIARHDFNDAHQIFNFRAYDCDYHFYQNCISIDSDRIEHYFRPLNSESGGFWFGGPTNNSIQGCISIKDVHMPYYIGGVAGEGHNTIENSIAIDVTVPGVPTLSAFVLKANTNVVASNLLGIGALDKKQDGFYGKKKGTFQIRDSIVKDVGNIGLWVNGASGMNHFNAGKCVSSSGRLARTLEKLGVGSSCWGKDATAFDPEKNGLKYPVRIEPDSLLASAGTKGRRCGPEILKKIGVSGTLYGENGWDEVTDENLWPFPNEKKIRELMRETVEGVSGKYGFCMDGQTLTNYIWGYFGNTVPPFNVQAKPEDGGALINWDAPAPVALATISGFNVYQLGGGRKTLMGATIQGTQIYSKKIKGLVNGKTYRFVVTAIDKEKGESGFSYSVSVTPEKKSVGEKSFEPKTEGGGKMPVRESREAIDAGKPSQPITQRKRFSNKLGMEFVFIPSGTFIMGILLDGEDKVNNAMPHQVSLTRGFYMQTKEVTQGQWKKLMGENPSFFKEWCDDCPVEQVSWNKVQQFIKRLNRLEGTDKYRLPSEAEWEYACRAENKTPFSFGKCLTTAQANYDGNHPFAACQKGQYRKRPVSTDSFPSNAWGLIGMHGNVWEWCGDWFGEYPGNTVTDPLGLPSGSLRVIRGGGWNSYAKACRAGSRGGIDPAKCYANLGFRVVRDR